MNLWISIATLLSNAVTVFFTLRTYRMLKRVGKPIRIEKEFDLDAISLGKLLRGSQEWMPDGDCECPHCIRRRLEFRPQA